MQTTENIRQSLEARADELERHMDQIAERASHASKDAGTHLPSQLSDLRNRLAEVRARLREKEEADNRTSDAALVQVDHMINDMYDELMSWPK